VWLDTSIHRQQQYQDEATLRAYRATPPRSVVNSGNDIGLSQLRALCCAADFA
jgi:hypothetical protein